MWSLRLAPSFPVGCKSACFGLLSCDCQVLVCCRAVGGWPVHLPSSRNLHWLYATVCKYCTASAASSVQLVLTGCTTAFMSVPLHHAAFTVHLLGADCAPIATLHGLCMCLSHIFVFHVTSEVQDVAVALMHTLQTLENSLRH